MIATFGVNGLKIFARSLRLLAHISNEFYIEAKPDGLIIRVVSGGQTSFCSITFYEFFFTSYRLTGDSYNDNNCKIAARPLLTILKNINDVVNCRIRLDSKKERFIIDIVKPKEIEIENTITILEHDNIEEFVPSSGLINKVICQPLLLHNLLKKLPKNIRELAFDVTKNRVEIKNHINHPEKDVQTVRLVYRLDYAEFSEYEVAEDTCLIILAQDFLSIIEFAEATGDDIKIMFSTNGEPMIVSVEKDASIKIEMVMATMREDTLKNIRKPPQNTSYKELMGSYIEGRLVSNDVDEQPEPSLFNFSDNGMLNPKVDSFVLSAKNTKASISQLRSNAKRKSSEMIETPTDKSIDVSMEIENPKKHKQNETLTQKEQAQVLQVITDLQLSQEGEEFDEIEVNAPRNSSSLKFLDGFQAQKVIPRSKSTLVSTLVGSQTDSESNGSERFNAGKANYPSEDLLPNPAPNRRRQTVSYDRNHQLHSRLTKTHNTNVMAKKLFGTMLKSKSTSPEGETYADNSDSEKSDKDDSSVITH